MAQHTVPPPPPVARVVLLGASNLRLGLSHVVELALLKLGGPLEFYVASGLGRSYGQWSSIPGRALPGITECALWHAVNERASLPTFALLTDVGNDLLYGASTQQVFDWVTLCADRLGAHDAQIVLTELPISSVLRTSDLRYKIFRTIFFPRSTLSFAAARDRALDLNERLRTLAGASEMPLVEMQSAWYAVDPIHVHRKQRRAAWQSIVQYWPAPPEYREMAVLRWKKRLSLQWATPHEWRLAGRIRRRVQPSVRLEDGSTVAMY